MKQAFTVVLALVGVSAGQPLAAAGPNLILVTGDDMGFQLGCYGDAVATTPHMDRLAREGMRFTRGYITQASCSSSRSSMLTGLYPHQNGQIGLAHLGYSMRPGVPTLPTLLKDPAFRWPAEVPLEEYRKTQRRAATGEYIELYDLQEDPCEFKNLAGQPELKAVQERLLKELQTWRTETQDPLVDLAALRAMVLKEKDAPPTPVPAWKKAKPSKAAAKR